MTRGPSQSTGRDDLLLASLKTKSLFRIRRHGVQVQYVERWGGQRVRALTHVPTSVWPVGRQSSSAVPEAFRRVLRCRIAARKAYALPCPADADAGISGQGRARPTLEPAVTPVDARVTVWPDARLCSPAVRPQPQLTCRRT